MDHVIADHIYIEAKLHLNKIGAGITFSDEIVRRPVGLRIKYFRAGTNLKIRVERSVFGMLQALYVRHEFQRRCVEDIAHPGHLAFWDILAAHHQCATHTKRGRAKKIFLQRDAVSIAAVHVHDRINALLQEYRRSGNARHMHLGGIGQLHRINHGLKDLALSVQRFCVRCLRQVHMGSHHEIFRLQGILERHTEH